MRNSNLMKGIQGKTLEDIANSIRAVDPNIQALSPQEMDDEIRRLTAVIDQTYNSESSNPIAGKAVKQAIDPLSEKVNQYDSRIMDAETNSSAAKAQATEALEKINNIEDNVVTQEELAWVELHVD